MTRPNRLYVGRPVGIVTVRAVMQTYPLDPRLDLARHSPAGFAWGYGGAGPAQLALALLADALGDDERAVRLHQDFKWRVVAKFGVRWQMLHSRVLVIAADIEQANALRQRA